MLAISIVPLLTAAGASAEGIASGPKSLTFMVPLDIFSMLLMKRRAQFDPGGISGTKLTRDNLSVSFLAAAGFTEVEMNMEADIKRTNNRAIFFIVLSLR